MRLWEQRVAAANPVMRAAGLDLHEVRPPHDRDINRWCVILNNGWPDVARRDDVPGRAAKQRAGLIVMDLLTWDDAYDQALMLRDVAEILNS